MKFILFDIEATCWDGYHRNGIQEIIELGAVCVDHFGEEVDRYVSFVRPVINPRLSRFCTDLTGITQREVDTALTFGEIYDEFEDWAQADADTWFVSWGDFDPDILNEECQRVFEASSMIRNYLDLQKEYASLKNVSPRFSLAKALEYEEIEFEGSHRAMTDTVHMKIIFNRYFQFWGMTNL
ncbi:MAG TPA: 3'-5' exonuclease [Membranihabitans sp.]|nr:3'-5' exonuclease [Membranihabitans sp.]